MLLRLEFVMPDLRLAGSLLRATPFIGDGLVALTELIPQSDSQGVLKPLFSTEPDAMQRVKNAAIIGGGGALASAGTLGLDAIPALAEFAGTLGEGLGAPKGPETINESVGCAPALNVEHYLRSVAYGTNHKASNQAIRKAGERCNQFLTKTVDEAAARPRFGGLVMPVN
jgi:hypothetical protein|tara:strand:+ start:15433 stop:15942 length:510 start_codon:yes stop_codon:yes gene_type:complete